MNTNLRVVLANDSFSPLLDGVVNVVKNYALRINSSYGTAVVATPQYKGAIDNYPYDVVRYFGTKAVKVGGYPVGYPFDANAMERLSAYGPTIIHSHCPFASSLLCRELRSITGAPLIFTYHTKFDIDLDRVLKLGFVKEAAVKLVIDNIETSDEVWVVNKGAGENLVSLGFNGNYRVMPNGVDFPRGPAEDSMVSRIDKEFSLDRSKPCFLFVGRMVWYKGQRIILDSVKKLRNTGHDLDMVFVGSGENLEDIEEYAKDIGVYDVCRFVGAERDRERLRAFYSRADMFILPSVFDNNPIVVKEASACATPSILIRDSSSSEGITDNVDGFLIDDNSDSLFSVMKTAYLNPSHVRAVGEKALSDIYVSWDDMVKNAVERYSDIITAKKNGELQEKNRDLSDKAIDMLADIQKRIDSVKYLFTDIDQ